MSTDSFSTQATFECTLCKKEYDNNNQLLQHFLSWRHQRKATSRAQKWDESMKERTVVAIALAKAGRSADSLEFVQLFSVGQRRITDYILSRNSPYTAAIQFDSSADVEAIIPGNARHLMWEPVDGFKKVLLRKASSLQPMEWSEFCPPPERRMATSLNEDEDAMKEVPIPTPMALDIPDQLSPPPPVIESKKVRRKRREAKEEVKTKKKKKKIQQQTLAPIQPKSPPNLDEDIEAIPIIRIEESSPEVRIIPEKSRRKKNEERTKKRRKKDNKKLIKNGVSSSSSPPHEISEVAEKTEAKPMPWIPLISVIKKWDKVIEVIDLSNVKEEEEEEEEEEQPSDDIVEIPQLWEAFNLLLSEVEQREEDHQMILSVMGDIKKAIDQRYPTAQLTLFRHNYLHLKNGGSNDLLIYFSSDGSQTGLWSSHMMEKAITTSSSSILPLKNVGIVEEGVPFLHQPTGIRFGLAAHPLTVPEVISCQLLQYLIKFDPRAKYLISVIHYWARVNEITLAEEDIPRIKQHEAIPDPSALEWLCLFFFGWKNLIPAPREVLRWPFKPGDAVSADKTKIILQDDELIARWRRRYSIPDENTDDFVVSVLQLAKDFFSFCFSNIFPGSVLNTLDTEIISKSVLLGNLKDASTKLTTKERNLLRRKLGESKDDDGILMMQPLCPSYCFSISKDKFRNVLVPAAQLSADKIGQFLTRADTIMQVGVGWPKSEIDVKQLFDNTSLNLTIEIDI
ncbi:unnamed protein product [Orchesella dallaii]|uniref:C2H2-type domain-containing protein n=1 Tax=Orchesella dallaii TaxID=48710 RepID=A0ABP1S4Q8_9HEXA